MLFPCDTHDKKEAPKPTLLTASYFRALDLFHFRAFPGSKLKLTQVTSQNDVNQSLTELLQELYKAELGVYKRWFP